MVDAAAAKKELAMPVNCQKPSSPPSSVHSPTETNHDNTAPVLAPNLNSQAYQQQLHDAMMALECSGMSANLMAAAAAAMAAAAAGVAVDQIASPVSDTQESASSSSTVTDTDARSPSTATSTEPSQSTSTPITEKPSIPGPLSASSEADLKHTKVKKELDQAKRDSIRTANRERKKKWRLHNEERNKDNDLRCRVNKRATKLFGPENTETKRNWAEEEFNKRREKRQEKERRKDVVNNVLSVPQSSSTKQPLTKPDPATPQESPTADDFNLPPVFDASKILEIPQELQRHLLEQLNIALSNSKLPTDVASTDETSHETPTDMDHTSAAVAAAAAVAVELLSQHQAAMAAAAAAEQSPSDPAQQQELMIKPEPMDIEPTSSSPAPMQVDSSSTHDDHTSIKEEDAPVNS